MTCISVNNIPWANMLMTASINSSFKSAGNFITKFRFPYCFFGWISSKGITPQTVEKAFLSMFFYERKYFKILLCLVDKRRSKEGSSCRELN
jgi:hypothetical protein